MDEKRFDERKESLAAQEKELDQKRKAAQGALNDRKKEENIRALHRKEKQLAAYVKDVVPASGEAKREAAQKWDSIAKPLNSLGKLEAALIRIAGMKGTKEVTAFRPALVTMCGDHGVVAEGVTQTGSEVTKLVAENFAARKACVTLMAAAAGVDVFPVDIGIDTDRYPDTELKPFTLIDRKIARGTGNIVWEPAMTEEQCIDALLVGIEIAGELKKRGYDILATGEMGIGNTTPASALTAAILNKDAREVTGRGAGLSSEGLERKYNAVDRAVKRFKASEEERKRKTGRSLSEEEYSAETGDKNGEEGMAEGLTEAALFEGTSLNSYGIRLMANLGGLEIAGMAGVFLGGAIFRIPVLVDGFISSAAALTAVQILPETKDYFLASHQSKEPAGKMVLDALGADPFLCCDMCLGEGSGAVASVPLLKMAAAVYNGMETFEEINLDQYEHFEEDEFGDRGGESDEEGAGRA